MQTFDGDKSQRKDVHLFCPENNFCRLEQITREIGGPITLDSMDSLAVTNTPTISHAAVQTGLLPKAVAYAFYVGADVNNIVSDSGSSVIFGSVGELQNKKYVVKVHGPNSFIYEKASHEWIISNSLAYQFPGKYSTSLGCLIAKKVGISLIEDFTNFPLTGKTATIVDALNFYVDVMLVAQKENLSPAPLIRPSFEETQSMLQNRFGLLKGLETLKKTYEEGLGLLGIDNWYDHVEIITDTLYNHTGSVFYDVECFHSAPAAAMFPGAFFEFQIPGEQEKHLIEYVFDRFHSLGGKRINVSEVLYDLGPMRAVWALYMLAKGKKIHCKPEEEQRLLYKMGLQQLPGSSLPAYLNEIKSAV